MTTFISSLSDIITGLQLTVSGAVALAIISIIGSLLFLPRPILCISAGFAFGLWAAPIVLIASTVGAALGLWISRYFAHQQISGFVEKRPVLKAVKEAIEYEGWRIVGLLRIASPLPFSLQNYLFGLTRIGTGLFAGVTMIGIAPAVFLYVYMGSAGRSALTEPGVQVHHYIALAVGMLALSVAIILVARRTRLALRSNTK